jgi:hypothetical protein
MLEASPIFSSFTIFEVLVENEITRSNTCYIYKVSTLRTVTAGTMHWGGMMDQEKYSIDALFRVFAVT